MTSHSGESGGALVLASCQLANDPRVIEKRMHKHKYLNPPTITTILKSQGVPPCRQIIFKKRVEAQWLRRFDD